MTGGSDRTQDRGAAAGALKDLARRLRMRITEGGPITFADFMEAALYDPEAGYYARPRVGEGGDFVTSPHVSPAFGALLARQVDDLWELLDKPEPFRVVEAGAGDGTLARHVIGSLSLPVQRALQYVAVDRSPGARAALDELARLAAQSSRVDFAAASDLATLPDPATARGIAPEDPRAPRVGCVLANELLDNLPFHRVRRTEAGLVELFVGWDGERFALTEGRPSSWPVVELAPALRPGEEGIASPAALAFVDAAATALDRGYILLIDYASAPAASGASGSTLVHGYRRHRVEADVLDAPGSRDITAGVDFAAVARHAAELGLAVWGPVSQRDAMFALGFREWDAAARAHQIEAAEGRRGIETLRAYNARSRASLLIDPLGLGGFQVLCLGVGVADAPLAFREA